MAISQIHTSFPSILGLIYLFFPGIVCTISLTEMYFQVILYFDFKGQLAVKIMLYLTEKYK